MVRRLPTAPSLSQWPSDAVGKCWKGESKGSLYVLLILEGQCVWEKIIRLTLPTKVRWMASRR